MGKDKSGEKSAASAASSGSNSQQEIYTVKDVMAARGCSQGAVLQAAKRLSVGRKLAGVWIFSQEDRDKLIAEIRSGPGNPNMGENQPAEYGRWGKKS